MKRILRPWLDLEYRYSVWYLDFLIAIVPDLLVRRRRSRDGRRESDDRVRPLPEDDLVGFLLERGHGVERARAGREAVLSILLVRDRNPRTVEPIQSRRVELLITPT